MVTVLFHKSVVEAQGFSQFHLSFDIINVSVCPKMIRWDGLNGRVVYEDSGSEGGAGIVEDSMMRKFDFQIDT